MSTCQLAGITIFVANGLMSKRWFGGNIGECCRTSANVALRGPNFDSNVSRKRRDSFAVNVRMRSRAERKAKRIRLGWIFYSR